MATSYTSKVRLAKPGTSDTGWGPLITGDLDALDELGPVGGLVVATAKTPSASLNVRVAAGKFADQSGAVQSYTGTPSQVVAANSTKVLYLDGAAGWALTFGTAYPSTPHVRLATVVTGSSTVTSITDDRQCFVVAGSIADGVN